MNPSFYGLAGRARVGKSTFVNLLADLVHAQDGRRVRDHAFAHALKAELDTHLIRTYGISAFTCNAADKAVIRPHLVARGAGARAEDLDHWVKLVEPGVRESLARGEVVICSDVRYANEARWVHSLGSKIIYISRLQADGAGLVPPANDEEARNDPEVQAVADIALTWPTLPLDQLRPYVERVWRELTQVEVVL